MHTTSASLLERLRQPNEQAAWERFVNLYTPLLCHWARRLGLKDPDVADLVQDVFAILVDKMAEFRYDDKKRFRGWLWTVTVNKARERQRRQQRDPVQASREETFADASVPDTMSAVEEAEYRQYLVRRAMQ